MMRSLKDEKGVLHFDHVIMRNNAIRYCKQLLQVQPIPLGICYKQMHVWDSLMSKVRANMVVKMNEPFT